MGMMAVRLTKKLLKLTPESFVQQIKERNELDRRLGVTDIYLSKKDFNTLADNFRKQLKKLNPELDKRALSIHAGVKLLPYSRMALLHDGVKPGMVIVAYINDRWNFPKRD